MTPHYRPLLEALGKEILLTTKCDRLNVLGQVFRPIFCGKVAQVTDSYVTLYPVMVKMSTAPFHRFPTPLSFPLHRISNFLLFDCTSRIPIP